MFKQKISALLLLALATIGQSAFAATAYPGPLGWAAVTNVAIGNCTPACNGIQSAGDIDINNAFSSITSPLDGSTAWAEAQLSNTSYTPVLRTFANSDDSAVEAFANGVQSYTNFGEARELTLDLSLSAMVTPGLGGVTDAVANVAVFALSGLDTLYTGLGSQLEGNGRDLFQDTLGEDARARLSISGVNSYVSPVADSISFFVGKGQSFLIWAGLQSKARNGGLSNAGSTFLIDINESNGDPVARADLGVTSLDSVGVVPLPAGVWLFLTGIGLVAGLSRRRRTS